VRRGAEALVCSMVQQVRRRRRCRGDEEIVGVDVALGDNGVDAAVEVVKVVTWIGVMDEIGKFFAVAGAAARIRIENDVALAASTCFSKSKRSP